MTYLAMFKPVLTFSNSKSKILDTAEREYFARFLKPSTNFSRMLECRGVLSSTLRRTAFVAVQVFVAYSWMVGGSNRQIVNFPGSDLELLS
ncbi:MAG: hypothetical protein Q7T89_11540 [Anaerolineales bacterium]|nr:hypothetical protein [Anaerolineales bacterium]